MSADVTAGLADGHSYSLNEGKREKIIDFHFRAVGLGPTWNSCHIWPHKHRGISGGKELLFGRKQGWLWGTTWIHPCGCEGALPGCSEPLGPFPAPRAL